MKSMLSLLIACWLSCPLVDQNTKYDVSDLFSSLTLASIAIEQVVRYLRDFVCKQCM